MITLENIENGNINLNLNTPHSLMFHFFISNFILLTEKVSHKHCRRN